MIDVHAFGNTSPKGAQQHWHAYEYEDSPSSVRRRSTFSRIASRLLVNRGTVERSTRRVISEDSPTKYCPVMMFLVGLACFFFPISHLFCTLNSTVKPN